MKNRKGNDTDRHIRYVSYISDWLAASPQDTSYKAAITMLMIRAGVTASTARYIIIRMIDRGDIVIQPEKLKII